MRIGENIRRIRDERGHTADQLAEMVGISSVSLRKYEYGERTPKEPMIEEIARALDVSPSTLTSDWGKGVDDAIHVLFDMEEAFSLRPMKVDGMYVLALPEDLEEDEAIDLAACLRSWYRTRRELEDGELTPDEYTLWKDSFRA